MDYWFFQIVSSNDKSFYLSSRRVTGQSIKGGFYEQELQKAENTNVYLVEKVLQRKREYLKFVG